MYLSTLCHKHSTSNLTFIANNNISGFLEVKDELERLMYDVKRSANTVRTNLKGAHSSVVYSLYVVILCRAVGSGVQWVRLHPFMCRKGPLNLRGRVKMTLRIQEKWT